MTTLSRLQNWKSAGFITGDQHRVLEGVVQKKPFSLYVELNTLLFLGVLSFIGGVSWVIQVYFAELGHLIIITTLTALFTGSLYYCLTRSMAYAPEFTESPNLYLDYVLYLGCLAFGLELTYLETQFQILKSQWDSYLLVSAALFFGLAYRFDNRFVLSLALSTLAAWFGLSLSRLEIASADDLRVYALVYGVIVALAGMWMYKRGVKKHFTDTYFHVGSTVLFIALVSGIIDRTAPLYLVALLAAGAIAVVEGIRFRRFSFVVYGIVYGYLGLTVELVRNYFGGTQAMLAYFIISGTIVVLVLTLLARRFGKEE